MVERTDSSRYHPGRSSVGSNGEGQHLDKPKTTAPETGCMHARDFDPDDSAAKTGSTSQPLLFAWIQENLFREGLTQ